MAWIPLLVLGCAEEVQRASHSPSEARAAAAPSGGSEVSSDQASGNTAPAARDTAEPDACPGSATALPGTGLDAYQPLEAGDELLILASGGCGSPSPALAVLTYGLGRLGELRFTYRSAEGDVLSSDEAHPLSVAWSRAGSPCLGEAFGLGWPLDELQTEGWCPWEGQEITLAVEATDLESGATAIGEVGPLRVVLDEELRVRGGCGPGPP